MNVQELIDILEKFDPRAEVRLCINWPDRVAEMHERLWVGDYGGGPQINAAMDFRGVKVYVGCVLEQRLPSAPPRRIELGQYETAEIAARVRDFYVFHRDMNEPLNFPDVDYDKWIPPRTTSGEYNPLIVEILKDKLLRE
jgi:hypothetical protein